MLDSAAPCIENKIRYFGVALGLIVTDPFSFELLRTGNCLKPGFEVADTAFEANLQLAIPKDEQGRELINPMGVDEANIVVQ